MLQQLKDRLALTAENKISVRVTPKSKRNELLGVEYDPQNNVTLRVKIVGVPEKGRVNEELIRFLAKTLDLPKSRLQIISGFTGRQKIIVISNHAL
jgi:uncharacterized protein (TIGR00251 family)